LSQLAQSVNMPITHFTGGRKNCVNYNYSTNMLTELTAELTVSYTCTGTNTT